MVAGRGDDIVVSHESVTAFPVSGRRIMMRKILRYFIEE
jgi:hypothetical protein